jgi:DNA-binding transcriptional MerR regulator
LTFSIFPDNIIKNTFSGNNMDTNKPPLYYNLGAVIRETGLNPDTLRAWERRYNLPQPTRSDGGQRLYTQKDLEILHWLIKKQETGLRISQAAELYHTQVEAGIDPIEEERLAAQTSPQPVVAGENLTAYRDAWLEAALNFNSAKADQITAEAFSLFRPETVAIEILFAGLRQIGNLWYHGQATVQQEHFASALVTRRLNALIAGAPVPSRKERIVIAAPPEEDHTLAPLMINYLLRRRGYEVIFLGADVPAKDFRSTIETLAPDLVILTAHLLLTAASMLELINEIDGLKTKLAFGGPVFINIPELRSKIPGTFLGDDL